MSLTIKSIPIQAYPESAWRTVLGVPTTDGDLTPIEAYRTVAAVHRCVKVRAQSVKRMPLALYRGKRDISDTPDGLMRLSEMRQLLYRAEASVCVYGAAYALKGEGRITGIPHLRWMTSASIRPAYDEASGLLGFDRTVGKRETFLALEKVWYAWLPDLAHDVGPDVAPVQVALAAAGVLANLDIFLENFFSGGAIKATLLRVKGNPPEAERKKLEAWWKKTIAGVKNVFTAAAVSADVEPMVIGDSLKDTVNVDLVTQKIEEVLIAMEVPASLVLPDAANYATARQDAISFYELCAIPQTQLYLDALNAQWLGPTFGEELVAMPERLEVFQQAELDKAGALGTLSGSPILTQSEARQRLELPPIQSDAVEQQRLALLSALAVMEAAVSAGYSTEDAAALAGLPAPTESAPPPPPPPAALPPPVDDEEPGADDEEAQADAEFTMRGLASEDLRRWQRKATKRMATTFESDWIDPHLATLISDRLCHNWPVAQAFKVAPPGSDLSDAEQRLYDALIPIIGKVPPALISAIVAGEPVDVGDLSGTLRAVLIPLLTNLALELALESAEAIGVDLDPVTAATAAGDWARMHAADMVTRATDATRDVVRRAVATYLDTPGMDRSQLTAMLQGAFSPRRAETIAITETTRAASAAQRQVQTHLAAAGLAFDRVWQTVKQETCPICEPLDGQAETDWQNQYPDGPPAHPRCRCAISLKRRI